MSDFDLSRRSLVKMSGLGVATAGLAGIGSAASAHGSATGTVPRLPNDKPVKGARTHRFDMTIEEGKVTVAKGKDFKVWAYNGQVPGPLIRVRQGDTIEAHVTNNTGASHTVHWHGIRQRGTWRMDGAPGINGPDISPKGGQNTYRFVADREGSLWYHCHVDVPNHVGVRGMWGPLIVDPVKPLPIEDDVTKDAILMFSGWASAAADDYFALPEPTGHFDYYSINGKSFPYNQPIRVRLGDVLRLRLYAVSIPVAFHLHGHDMLVTHEDGLPLATPYYCDTVKIDLGKRVDVIVRMDNPGRWPAHDHDEHHTHNGGMPPGGVMLIVEYDEAGRDDPWYMWRRKEFDPDFYFIDSMKKGHGLIPQSGFRASGVAPAAGVPPSTAGTPAPAQHPASALSSPGEHQ